LYIIIMLTKRRLCAKKRDFHFANIIPHSLTYPNYNPASTQATDFHQSKKHIKFLFGGDRAGKTGTVSYDFISKIRELPGKLYWAVGLTEDKLSAIWRWHKEFLANWEIKHINWRVTEEIPRFIKLQCGGKIEYKTWKSGPGSFSADSVPIIQLDEDGQRVSAAAEQTYNDCLSRIIDCDGYILGGATPVLGKNWMYQRIYLYNAQNRADKSPDPDIARWTVSLLDNKYITTNQKEKAKGRMSKDEIERRFYGLFTILSGAVFKEWREDLSAQSSHFENLPVNIRKVTSIDLGARHPFVALFGGEHDGKLYIWDEYSATDTLLKIHAKEIIKRESDISYFSGDARFNRPIETRLCDHERQTRIELENYGIWTDPAQKDRELNRSILNRLMMPDAHNVPDLLIHPRCADLIRTIPIYRYKTNRSGTDQKEDAIKEDDDWVDPLMYMSRYFFKNVMDFNASTATAEDCVSYNNNN